MAYRISSLAMLAVAICLPPCLAEEPAGGTSLGGPKAAWRARHDRVASLRASFSCESTYHRAYYESAPSRRDGQRVVPDADYTGTYACEVVLKGDHFKYSYTGSKWSPLSKRMEPDQHLAITRPDEQVFANEQSGGSAPSVSVSNRRDGTDECSLTLVPLMLAVRSKHTYHRQVGDYTPTGKTVPVEGRACSEFVTGSKSDRWTEYLYLDPDRDWVTRRLDKYAGDKLITRYLVEYASSPEAGWLPTTWSVVQLLPDGRTSITERVNVQRYEVNGDVPDAEFRPALRPGTFVVNDTRGQGNETVSVVRADGTPGVELPLADRPSYEELVGANQSTRRQWWWLGGIAVVGLAVILLAAARRRHRAAAPP